MRNPTHVYLCLLGLAALASVVIALPLQEHRWASGHAALRKRSAVLPLKKVARLTVLKIRADKDGDGDDDTGAVGLGNTADFVYTVSVQLGNYTAPFHLDTGSSDLWVASDACTTGTCVGSNTTLFPMSNFVSGGGDVRLTYGDSISGTFALGPVAQADATLAGIKISGQPFGAMNATNNTVLSHSAGIFGLGFPSASQIQAAVVTAKSGGTLTVENFINNITSAGPLLSRLAIAKEIDAPMFSVTLQRNTVNVGGNQGSLTIGELPAGIDNSTITWVPVRLYPSGQGGLAPPSFAAEDVYPLRWEVAIDGVFFDGQKLPDSTLSNGTASALIDTGNSILRGPRDVVSQIYSIITPGASPAPAAPPSYPCATPHNLAFQIGGKMFPVDPRDFVSPGSKANADTCSAGRLVATDPPNNSGQLFQWSLGDPFLKSNLVVFYYGNLTNPSVDPPRMGFLSTVPTNSTEELKDAVKDAKANGGNFESTAQAAPTSELPEGAFVNPSLTSSIPASSTTVTGPSARVAAGQVTSAPVSPTVPSSPPSPSGSVGALPPVPSTSAAWHPSLPNLWYTLALAVTPVVLLLFS